MSKQRIIIPDDHKFQSLNAISSTILSFLFHSHVNTLNRLESKTNKFRLFPPLTFVIIQVINIIHIHTQLHHSIISFAFFSRNLHNTQLLSQPNHSKCVGGEEVCTVLRITPTPLFLFSSSSSSSLPHPFILDLLSKKKSQINK